MISEKRLEDIEQGIIKLRNGYPDNDAGAKTALDWIFDADKDLRKALDELRKANDPARVAILEELLRDLEEVDIGVKALMHNRGEEIPERHTLRDGRTPEL